MVTLRIELSEEELSRLEIRSQSEGFESVEAYVRSLVIEPTKAELLSDIREGILAAMRGEPMSTVDEMWEGLENEGDE